MSKKKKNKGKKALWRKTRPNQINQVAKDLFGGKYYCIGDKPERPRKETRQENGLV